MTLSSNGTSRAPLWARAEGFSLVEAIAAAGLLSVVLLGFGMGAGRAIRYNEYSRTLATATTLTHDKIEQLENLVATDPQLTAGAHSDALNPLTATGTTGGIYTRTWQVTDNTPVAGMKTVQLTVQWSRFGESHTVRVTAVKI